MEAIHGTYPCPNVIFADSFGIHFSNFSIFPIVFTVCDMVEEILAHFSLEMVTATFTLTTVLLYLGRKVVALGIPNQVNRVGVG